MPEEKKSFGKQVGNTGVNLKPLAFSSRSFGISTLTGWSRLCLKWLRRFRILPNARSIIGFLHSKGQRPADIHKEIVSVYGNIMNRQNVMKWCRHFSEGKTDVHDKQRTGWPSVISDALLQRIEESICANRRLKLKELHQIILEVSMTTLYEVVTVKLGT
ncbi:uncharacterized protein TNCV_5052111 [Trichonephila clavipes]|nr:uncharacterized protein TNCV_5052111 [Trichonephila clavipes]